MANTFTKSTTLVISWHKVSTFAENSERDEEDYTYCSKAAGEILAKEGYTVYELSTGFNGWLQAGYKSEDALIVIDESHERLTIYYPQYNSINLEYGANSSEENPVAIFYCPAAFTGDMTT